MNPLDSPEKKSYTQPIIMNYGTVSHRMAHMEAEKIQTLDRIVQILDCFTIEQHELGVREVGAQDRSLIQRVREVNAGIDDAWNAHPE